MDNLEIYLVSLKEDIVRRELIKSSFPSTYSQMNLVEAVNGSQLTVKQYFDYAYTFAAKYSRMLSPGELGCTLSHIAALEKFLKSDKNFALVLEDDVIGCDDDIKKIEELLPFFDQNILLICGGQDGIGCEVNILGKVYGTHDVFKLAPFSYQYVWRTCCYVVSRLSARIILDYQKKCICLADSWKSYFHGTPIKIYYTKILSHPKDLVMSSISNEREKLYAIKKKPTFLFCLKNMMWRKWTFLMYKHIH